MRQRFIQMLIYLSVLLMFSNTVYGFDSKSALGITTSSRIPNGYVPEADNSRSITVGSADEIRLKGRFNIVSDSQGEHYNYPEQDGLSSNGQELISKCSTMDEFINIKICDNLSKANIVSSGISINNNAYLSIRLGKEYKEGISLSKMFGTDDILEINPGEHGFTITTSNNEVILLPGAGNPGLIELLLNEHYLVSVGYAHECYPMAGMRLSYGEADLEDYTLPTLDNYIVSPNKFVEQVGSRGSQALESLGGLEDFSWSYDKNQQTNNQVTSTTNQSSSSKHTTNKHEIDAWEDLEVLQNIEGNGFYNTAPGVNVEISKGKVSIKDVITNPISTLADENGNIIFGDWEQSLTGQQQTKEDILKGLEIDWNPQVWGVAQEKSHFDEVDKLGNDLLAEVYTAMELNIDQLTGKDIEFVQKKAQPLKKIQTIPVTSYQVPVANPLILILSVALSILLTIIFFILVESFVRKERDRLERELLLTQADNDAVMEIESFDNLDI